MAEFKGIFAASMSVLKTDLSLDIEAVRSHGKVWKYKGIAKVNEKKMAEAEWAATIVDRKK